MLRPRSALDLDANRSRSKTTSFVKARLNHRCHPQPLVSMAGIVDVSSCTRNRPAATCEHDAIDHLRNLPASQ